MVDALVTVVEEVVVVVVVVLAMLAVVVVLPSLVAAPVATGREYDGSVTMDFAGFCACGEVFGRVGAYEGAVIALLVVVVVEEEGTVRAGVPEFVFVFFAVDTFG
jgi:hypothetical protein